MFKSLTRLKPAEFFIIIISIGLTGVIFYLINNYFTGQGMIFWALVQTAILWVIVVSLLLLADNHRVLNEELKQILREEIKESQTLKEISHEQLREVKIIKDFASKAFSKKKKKK